MSEIPSKVGGVTFKASAVDIMPLCPSIQAQMENRIYWHLYSHKYTEQKWSQVMKHIDQIQVQEMQLSDNDYEYILKQITPVSFPILTSLSLISNNIRSLEPLSQARMPNLLYLHICRNQIMRLAPLRKAYWPKLTRIIMNDNPLVDAGQVLPQCYFPDLQIVILEGWLDSIVFLSDISPLMKLQTTGLKYLNINSELRINQASLLTQLTQKHKELKVRVND